ncbi:pilus assembly protein PilM [Patescibacteria group bacterium]|nr:pilus assembly protein PilM [Patescibacteria group bacterium]
MQLGEGRKIKSHNRVDIDFGVVENGKILKQEILSQSIEKAIKGAKPKPPQGDRVVASLPDSQLFTSVFQISYPADEKDFESRLLDQARQNIPLDLDGLFMDYCVFYPGTEKQQVLFVAAPKEIVNNYFKTLVAVGLKPIAFDMESGCLGRCLLKKDFIDKSVMIVDIGARTSIISVFKSAGPCFSMNIPVAGNEFTKKISQSLNVEFSQAEKLKIKLGIAGKDDQQGVGDIIKKEMRAIIDEIKQAKEYYAQRLDIDLKKILLVGGSSAMKGLPQYLQEQLGIDVAVGNTKERPMYTAYGLALRGLAKDPRIDGINLLPQQ